MLSKPRLAFGTLSTVCVSLAAVGPAWTGGLMAMAALLCVLSAAYGHCVIGGVVGDYLGATIMVAELAVYMALTANWEALFAADDNTAWHCILTCALISAIPVVYARRIVDFNASC